MNRSTRREFLRMAGWGSLGLAPTKKLWALSSPLFPKEGARCLTLLYTNDQHSRIDPFPENAPRHAGEGGFARRYALIQHIRRCVAGPVVLVDAGDVFQGTPYFNFYGGRLEFELMSMMGYDACTLGNHDFDNGLQGLIQALPYARFPFVCSNYDFSATELKGKTKRFLVLNKGGLRVGIYGLGISPDNLIPERLFGKTIFLDPLHTALEMEELLHRRYRCHLIVCLSHLGYAYEKESRISDKTLAPLLRYTHVIVGGHTHTFLEQPDLITGREGHQVVVTQAGWAGLRLGRIDFQFNEKKHILSARFLMEKVF
ncbi:MAG: metallophosphoesterase [Flavobacteriales bacterium]|nr:metallophosphoesterase [Flavobacteriales bacterium]MCX7768691.1 metallophosphoesterase [Flavobacteriales bacterium]MDW8410110.1 metallophosphoesterase [Flavobacteriales bacterium]